ncbi:hypothetical protein LOZ58_003522 [Ophidiomyces ophidiicola]|nr:hypothetical protein LOZ66_005102 [Ophidiomyces ophidiicola]KAI1961036.1 hypothetical protein LOZ58_003522 [Ophidiomyces ophidiicola]
MAEDSFSKKIKLTGPLIGTHNGRFHADEALAVYLLRMLPEYSSSPVIRTREPGKLEGCSTVVDVGGEYNISTHRYDHHQRGFAETFPGHTTKLSSAGLIYLNFGKDIVSQHMAKPDTDPDVGIIYEKLYTDFIEALDAHDNGISTYDPQGIDAAGLTKRFRNGGVHLAAVVGDMNVADPGEELDEDGLFEKASKFIGDVFSRKLRAATGSWLPARGAVKAAYESRFDVHPSGRVIMFKNGGVPWKEHLYQFEQAAPGVSTLGQTNEPVIGKEVYYVLYPESTEPSSKWRLQCVPQEESSFVSRKPLPESWRGMRDADLDKVIDADAQRKELSKPPPGAVFTHASGFIGGHASKEGVLQMASICLAQD